jgi:hypothetical protein
MKSRALRFALHALFVVLVVAAAYVVWQKETDNLASANASRAFDERAPRPSLDRSSKSRAPSLDTSPPARERTTGCRASTRLIAGAREGLTRSSRSPAYRITN